MLYVSHIFYLIGWRGRKCLSVVCFRFPTSSPEPCRALRPFTNTPSTKSVFLVLSSDIKGFHSFWSCLARQNLKFKYAWFIYFLNLTRQSCWKWCKIACKAAELWRKILSSYIGEKRCCCFCFIYTEANCSPSSYFLFDFKLQRCLGLKLQRLGLVSIPRDFGLDNVLVLTLTLLLCLECCHV